MSQLTMEIKGMSCGHCVKAVQQALETVPGVTVQQVAIGSATVNFDEQVSSVQVITDAVTDAGYEASAA